MKKLTALLTAVLLTFSLTACKTDTAAAPAAEDGQNPVMNFVGVYECDRASILVEAKGQNEAAFTVNWGSSASENTEWTMSGTFDEEGLYVYYSDCVRRDLVYNEDGSIKEETKVYTGGKGSIIFKDDGALTLTWDDQAEHAADGMTFTYLLNN